MTTNTSDPGGAGLRDAYQPGVHDYRDAYYDPATRRPTPTSWPRSG